MKNLKWFTALLVISSALSSCYSGRKAMESDAVVSPLSQKTAVTDGSIIYALPRTVFNIVVETERTIEKPGPYWRYAGDL
ncbi:MAG: hypothetical protein ACM3UT_04105, partial [Chloroflexota bacterium]